MSAKIIDTVTPFLKVTLRTLVLKDAIEYQNAVALEVESELKEETPVRTGQLMRSWRTEFARSAGAVARIINDQPYGPLVNYGTARMRGRHFVERVEARIKSIAARVARRLF